jgi:hypothetical protein
VTNSLENALPVEAHHQISVLETDGTSILPGGWRGINAKGWILAQFWH